MKIEEPESPGIKEAAVTAAVLALVALLLSAIGIPFHGASSGDRPEDHNVVILSEGNQ
jgi:hypothetical protein